MGGDQQEEDPIPENSDLTALRKAQAIRRRRARGGRESTVNPQKKNPGPDNHARTGAPVGPPPGTPLPRYRELWGRGTMSRQ